MILSDLTTDERIAALGEEAAWHLLGYNSDNIDETRENVSRCLDLMGCYGAGADRQNASIRNGAIEVVKRERDNATNGQPD